MTSGPFRILLVCTGNVCRSAQAQQLMQARTVRQAPALAEHLSFGSAGTRALARRPMPEEAAALSRAHGGASEGHCGTQLTKDMVRDADLVLGMAREHRRDAVKLVPAASRWTFMLTEFAALLDDLADTLPELPEDWAELGLREQLRRTVRWAAGRRGFTPELPESFVAVVDPYGASAAVYEESADQIIRSLDRMENAAQQIWEGIEAQLSGGPDVR